MTALDSARSPGRLEEQVPMLFVSVGTDHHPFDRLILWIDRWLADGGASRVRCLVQRGTSKAPAHAPSVDYLAYQDMQQAVHDADVVISHGGPGNVMLCRWVGIAPIVVPRRKRLGEHVDDHQVVFSRRIAAAGEVLLAEDEATFRRILDDVATGNVSVRTSAPDDQVAGAVERFGSMVDDLLSASPSPRLAAVSGEAGSPSVVYIGGWGRSGSTLLDRILGQVPTFVAVGEVRELWQRGLRENRTCGCGAAFHDCPFWSEVGLRAFGGWEALDLEHVLSLRYSLDRGWMAPVLLSRARTGLERKIQRYLEYLGPLYRAIASTACADVVVDSSKLPMHAMLLDRIPLDVRLVHLVRDSRGVAFSWRKELLRDRAADGAGKGAFLHRYDPVSASARYLLYNGITGRLRRRGIPSLLLRYEDLVAGPATAVRRIAAFAGSPVEADSLSFIGPDRVEMRSNHTVDGNPMRFSVGTVRLTEDEEWKAGMGPIDRVVVSAITSPLLRRYGYPLGNRDGG